MHRCGIVRSRSTPRAPLFPARECCLAARWGCARAFRGARHRREGELSMSRPPLPPYSAESAAQKARMAEDAWNSRDPLRVSLAYTEDSRWRNRSEFFRGRDAIVAFLTRKWERELDYRLIKEVWA